MARTAVAAALAAFFVAGLAWADDGKAGAVTVHVEDYARLEAREWA